MRPSEIKKFLNKVVKVEILDHASYKETKEVLKEEPCVITSYGLVRTVAKDSHDRWFLNITYDIVHDDQGKFMDESGSTYLLTDILSIVELHE